MAKKFDVREIIDLIIGKTMPIGETNEDDKRFDNLKNLIDLTDSLVSTIAEIDDCNRGRAEYSMNRAGELAYEYLKELKDG